MSDEVARKLALRHENGHRLKNDDRFFIFLILINIFYFHAVLYTTYFKILNNLYLSTKNSSTEIDVVTIHETGIYVFESKNFSGWIYGGYKQKEWTQKLEHFQNHFYNPIWQNKGHISALKNVFHLSKWMKCI